MRNFFKRSIVVFSAVFILAGIGAYFYFFSKPAALPDVAAAKKGAVIQEVSVTGRIKPAENVDLAFEKGGKVAEIGANVGDRVNRGKIIVRLESGELIGQLREMEGNVEAQRAELDELKKGTRPEEITFYGAKVTNAKVSLDEAKKTLVDKLQDAYTKSDDGVRAKADQLFDNPRSANPQLKFSATSKSDIENSRLLIEAILNSWNSSLGQILTKSDLDAYSDEANKNLDAVKSFLDKLASAVNNLTSNASLSQTTIDTWKTDVSTSRTNVYTAITNFSTAKEKFKTAETALLVAEEELALKKAGSTAEQIAGQEAQLKQAEAKVQTTQAQIAKTLLTSPINGIVTRQDAKAGEIVAANTVIVSVISESQFEIEANVPEVDIAKVKVGDRAKVTLDAYGSDIFFEANVSKIDPGETEIEGVATYKTTLQFSQKDERVKSGMTANIDILTAQKENVIVIPQRLVISKNGDKIVKVLGDDKSVKEIKVETGLRGSDGNIEIISGLSEGDKIVTSIKE